MFKQDQKATQKIYRATHKVEIAKKKNEWREKNKERDWKRSRVYYRAQHLNTTREEILRIEAISDLQGRRCPICNVQMIRGGRGQDGEAIDHNHKTGQIRGAICKRCNLLVAHLENNTELVGRAFEYINGHILPI